MQSIRSRNAFLSLAAALAAGALVVNAASCATSVQQGAPGTDASTDGAGPDDATMDTSTSNPDTGTVEQCDADTMTDPSNCGSCGSKCPSGNTCSCGTCTPPCTGNLTPCCGKCVDVTKDPNNCGSCGTPCMAPMGSVPGIPVCDNGACGFTCPLDAGAADAGPIVQCGADSGTPGCFDLTSSASACGSCGHVCQGTDTCSESTCCPAGSGLCGGSCTDLNTATNCGACGVACPAPATCTNGQCVGYVESNPVATFIDACSLAGATTITKLSGASSWTASVPAAMPFTFSFYGASMAQFWLGSQGTMGFGGVNIAGFPDCSGSGPPPIFTAYPAIVAFGDSNLVPGTVCWATQGTAPNRQLVATWKNNTEALDPSFALDFSIVLSETTNAIDLLYSAPAMAVDAGTDAAADAGVAADGGTTPITDQTVAGVNATIGMQLGTGPNTVIACDKAFLTVTPYDVHLIP